MSFRGEEAAFEIVAVVGIADCQRHCREAVSEVGPIGGEFDIAHAHYASAFGEIDVDNVVGGCGYEWMFGVIHVGDHIEAHVVAVVDGGLLGVVTIGVEAGGKGDGGY